MSDALRGVMWSFSFPQQLLGKWNHFFRPCARFIWRCFTVAVVAMSLRAFYDRTLIVEALFYTESYFRIQYVLLYNKCIVWRKLNKCCFKTEACSPCLCLHSMQRSLLHVPWLVFTHADLWPQKNHLHFFETSWKHRAQRPWVRFSFQMWFGTDKTSMTKSYLLNIFVCNCFYFTTFWSRCIFNIDLKLLNIPPEKLKVL